MKTDWITDKFQLIALIRNIDTKIKEEIEKLIKNYRLRKSKEIQVKMNITLHDYEYYIHKDEISI